MDNELNSDNYLDALEFTTVKGDLNTTLAKFQSTYTTVKMKIKSKIAKKTNATAKIVSKMQKKSNTTLKNVRNKAKTATSLNLTTKFLKEFKSNIDKVWI